MEFLKIEIILRTLKISMISTSFVTVISFVLVYMLEKTNPKIKIIGEMFINISLFVSPSVLGYILILILGKRGVIGGVLYKYFDISIMFSWYAGIISAFVVSLPLMYNNIKTGVSSINNSLLEAGKEMGANDYQIFYLIILPLIKKNIFAGIILSFGRAIGEFGATLMLAGNIPRKTQTISMAIYSASESGDSATANFFLIVILIISFLVMSIYNYLFLKSK